MPLQPNNPRRGRPDDNGRVVSQPLRPAVPTAWAAMRFCHVKRINDPESDFVPVQIFDRTGEAPWEGGYEYVSEIEQATVMPGLKARHYKAFEYLGDAWTPDANTRLLLFVAGNWYVHHPYLLMIGADVMTSLVQKFGNTSCFPSPFTAETSP